MAENPRDFKAGIQDGTDNRRITREKSLRKNRRAKLHKMRHAATYTATPQEFERMVAEIRSKTNLGEYVDALRRFFLAGEMCDDYYDKVFDGTKSINMLITTLDQPLTPENTIMMRKVAVCVACISGHEINNEWVPELIENNILDVLAKHLRIPGLYSDLDFYDSLLMICGNICFDDSRSRDKLCSFGIIPLITSHFDDNPSLSVRIVDFFNSLFVCKPLLSPQDVNVLWVKVRPFMFQSESLGVIISVYRMLSSRIYQSMIIQDRELLVQLINIVRNPKTTMFDKVSALGGFRQLALADAPYMIQHYNIANVFIEMLADSAVDVQHSAACGLATCASAQDISIQFCQPRALSLIQQMFRKTRVWRVTSEILWTILFVIQCAARTNNAAVLRLLCDTQMLTHVATIFVKPATKLRIHALNVIRELLVYPSIVESLENARVISAVKEQSMSLRYPTCSKISEQIMQTIEARGMDIDDEVFDI